MATVARLNVEIGADIKSFQQGMAKMQNQFKQVGANLRNTGRKLSTAVTLPILGIAAAAVKAAADAEEMQSKFKTVFQTVGGDVTKQLDAFSRASGRSRYELRGMAAQLGDIFKPLGYTEQQAGNLSVQVSKLAVDLGSFNNMPMDEALARLRGTLVGSHENALAFGVVINEASLKQELMRMGADKLTGAQLNQAKVQARLNLLMEGTVDAQGDAIRTAGSFTNQLIRLKNEAKDLGVAIGELIIPHAKQLVGLLQGMVDYVANLSTETKKTAIAFVGWAAALGPIIFVLGGLAASISAIVGFVAMLAPLFNPVVAGLAALAAVAVIIYRNWNLVTEAFFGTISAIENLIKGSLNTLLETVKGLFGAVALAIEKDFKGAWEALKTTVTTYGGGVVTEVSDFVEDVGAATTPLAWNLMFDPLNMGDVVEGGLLATLKEFFGGVSSSAASSLDTDDDSVKSSAEKAKDALAKIKTEVGNIEALAPSFKTVEDALSGAEVSADDVQAAIEDIEGEVDNLAALAPNFSTLKKALGISRVPTIGSIAYSAWRAGLGIIGVGDEVAILEKIQPDFSTITDAINAPTGSIASNANDAKGAVKDLYDQIPSELELPEGYEKLLDVVPDANETHRWGQYVVGMENLATHLSNARGNAYEVARYMRDVGSALDTLGVGEDKPFGKFVGKITQAALDVVTVISGFEALAELLKAETWTSILENALGLITDIVDGIRFILTGNRRGTPDFTGGGPGISIPGSGGQGTPTGVPTGTGTGGEEEEGYHPALFRRFTLPD